MSEVLLGTRGAFSLSGAMLPLILSSLAVSGSGFSIRDTGPLGATETDEGPWVSKSHIPGTANLMGHPSPLCGWVGNVTWPSTHLAEAKGAGADSKHRRRLQGPQRGPNVSN